MIAARGSLPMSGAPGDRVALEGEIMTRDWECIRAILAALDEKGDASSPLPPDRIAGYDRETVSYHMNLLIEAGLIEGRSLRSAGGPYCMAQAMTWEGHELLDKIRSEKIWNRVKTMAREQAVPLSFQAVKILAGRALETLLSAL